MELQINAKGIDMIRTKVIATKPELKQIAELVKDASAIVGGTTWSRLQEVVHDLALTHGLPEIPGFYGLDQKNGEFLRA